MMAEEKAVKIQGAIAALHQRDREILLLKYDQGWSYHDLTKQLGISHSAVEARLYRARQRLRQMLKQRDVVASERRR